VPPDVPPVFHLFFLSFFFFFFLFFFFLFFFTSFPLLSTRRALSQAIIVRGMIDRGIAAIAGEKRARDVSLFVIVRDPFPRL